MKLLIIAGARPNFMKVAPIIRAIQRHSSQPSTLNPQPASPSSSHDAPAESAIRNPQSAISYKLVHTGQHYDQKMSDIFFSDLGIPAPDINLGVGSGSHAVQTANVMTRFETVCLEEKPDWVVVVGDVNSTMACTLVCSKMGIRVAHVEAGLRSYDRTMPEEINRIVTDSLADLLLTPSEDANENLRREGIPAEKIRLVGNVMIDTLVSNLEKAEASPVAGRLGLARDGFVYVTLHRPSNVDTESSLAAIMSELKRLAADLPVVFPMHPRTRKMCDQFGISLNGSDGLRVIDPVGYHDSLYLTGNARLVLTDSGGLQEESTYFRTPCLTLRPNTERPVTVTLGSNRLTCVEKLPADIAEVLDRDNRFGSVPPLWDGHTAERIIEAIAGAAPSIPGR